jgi:SAM-dependent methyltransferase
VGVGAVVGLVVEVVAVSESPYLMNNVHPETGARFEGLERTLDPISIGHLSRVGVEAGGRCLEIGTGGGSIARWLASRVGRAGRVVAVDLDTRWFHHDGTEQLEVLELDVVAGPIPDGPWDLIHERLVLQHVPARLDVLDRLVERLAPGGWLVLEDFDTGEIRTTDRAGPHHELIVRMATAFNQLLAERDGANNFAADAWRHLRQRGLLDTGASGHVVFDCGGEGFTQVMAANARQVSDGLARLGITAEDISQFLEVLADPDTIIGTSVLISAWGRRTSAFR